MNILTFRGYQFRDSGISTNLSDDAKRQFIAQAEVLTSLAELSLESDQNYYTSSATIYQKLTEAIAALNATARIYISQGNQNAADPFLRHARELEVRRDRNRLDP